MKRSGSFGGRIKLRPTKEIKIVPVNLPRRLEELERRVAELEALLWSRS